MITSVKIERYKNYEELMRVVSRCEACPATDKDFVKPLNYEMLIATHLPESDWHRIGALVTLLFRDPLVKDVEIWRINNGDWIADALVESARGHRLRRGEGETPTEAALNLVLDIQRY
jgi:hypothetical protein